MIARFKPSWAAFPFLFHLSSSVGAAPPPAYQLIEDAAPGATVSATFGLGENAVGIRYWPFPSMNDFADVVGRVYPADDNAGQIGAVAAVWRDGQLTELGVAGCVDGVSNCGSRAVDLNNAGIIVGASNADASLNAYGGAYYEHEFRAIDGQIHILRGGEFGWASGINELGNIIANTRYSDYLVHGYLQDSSSVTIIGEYGQATVVNALNESNEVVGAADFDGNAQAFLWRAGQLIQLGTLGGATSEAFDINEGGQVVGSTALPTGDVHAFIYSNIYSNGTMQDLGTLGGSESVARAVNDAGQVVGYARDGEGNPRAFVWDAGEMYDLNDHLPDQAGWVLVDAYDINAYGEILVRGINGLNQSYLILSPPGVTKPPRPELTRVGDPVAHVASHGFGGGRADVAALTAADGVGATYIAGNYSSRPADFDPGDSGDLVQPGASSSLTASAFLTRMNADGSYAWTVPVTSTYSSARINLRDMVVDSDGNVIIGGTVYTFGGFQKYCYDFDPSAALPACPRRGVENAFVAKYAPAGELVWLGYMEGWKVYANGLATGANGDVYVTGSYRLWNTDLDPDLNSTYLVPGGNSTGFVTKLDAQGRFQWAKLFEPVASPLDTYADYATVMPASVSVAETGEIFVSGTFSVRMDLDPGDGVVEGVGEDATRSFVVRLSPGGDYDWSRVSTTYANATAVQADSRGGAYVLFDNRLQRLDAKGAVDWTHTLAVPVARMKTDNAWRVFMATDAVGNVYLPGRFYGVTDFDGGAGYDFLSSDGVDGFVTRISASGAYDWTVAIGGGGTDSVVDVAVDAAGNLHVAGNFDSADLDCDEADDVAPIASHGYDDAFLIKMGSR